MTKFNLDEELNNWADFQTGLVPAEKEYNREKARVIKAITANMVTNEECGRRVKEASEFQVYFEKGEAEHMKNLWVARIAHNGQQVYGDVHKSEKQGRERLEAKLEELAKLTKEGEA